MTISKHSEVELINEVVSVARANGLSTSYELAEKQVWEYLCSQEPERAKNGERLSSDGASDADVLTRTRWGPWIWNFMALAAARFQSRFFFQLLDQVPILMTCPECRDHWRDIVKSNPPSSVRDAKSACVWVNQVHNSVNERIGKRPYSYEQMVAEYGAPP